MTISLNASFVHAPIPDSLVDDRECCCSRKYEISLLILYSLLFAWLTYIHRSIFLWNECQILGQVILNNGAVSDRGTLYWYYIPFLWISVQQLFIMKFILMPVLSSRTDNLENYTQKNPTLINIILWIQRTNNEKRDYIFETAIIFGITCLPIWDVYMQVKHIDNYLYVDPTIINKIKRDLTPEIGIIVEVI